MMTESDNLPQFDEMLLDYHLGRLSASERERLEVRLAGDAELRAAHDRLREIFAGLDTLRTVQAPIGLAERVAAGVRERAAQSPRLAPPVETEDLARHQERTPDFLVRSTNLRDIIAVAAMIVLVVGLGVPSVLSMREAKHRTACSWNLAQIGRGVQNYIAFNAGMPFAGWSRGASWLPNGDPQTRSVPNRRHIYPLLRLAYISEPAIFVCPSSWDQPMAPKEIWRHRDFLRSDNLSYAYYNMSGAHPDSDDDPSIPILADDNPLFRQGVFVRPFGVGDEYAVNSEAHGGDGQNILTLDGHVKWVTTPKVGVDGDNIWTLQNVEVYTGREGPRTTEDSHLLK